MLDGHEGLQTNMKTLIRICKHIETRKTGFCNPCASTIFRCVLGIKHSLIISLKNLRSHFVRSFFGFLKSVPTANMLTHFRVSDALIRHRSAGVNFVHQNAERPSKIFFKPNAIVFKSCSHVALLGEFLIGKRLDRHPSHRQTLSRCGHIIAAFFIAATTEAEIGNLK